MDMHYLNIYGRFFKHILYIYIAYVAILCVVYPQIVADSFETHFTIILLIIIAISRFSEYFMSIAYKLYIDNTICSNIYKWNVCNQLL